MNTSRKNFAATVVTAGIVLSMSLGAQAEEAVSRYLVQYHSPGIVQNVARQLSAPALSLGGAQTRVRVMHNDLRVVNALRNTRMLEILATSSEIADLKNDPNVALVEKEYFFPAPQPLATRTAKPATLADAATLPDPKDLFDEGEITWGLKAVQAVDAWKSAQSADGNKTMAGRGTRVLVLDTGIDRDHTDIASRFEAGRNFLARTTEVLPGALNNLLPSAANLLGGAEGSSTKYDYFDENGHGTHVAGTILGAYNGSGVSGVAPLANLLAGRVCGKFGCTSVGIIRGIEYGIEQKVDVLNMSLGGPVASAAAREAVAAADRANVTVICASGNDGQPTVSFPAAYPGSFAVGAIDSRLAKASFSNWGPELAIVAPGVDVLSSVPTGSGREAKVEVDGPVKGEVKSKSFVGAEENEVPLTAELVFVGLGKPEDFTGKDLRGKLALIQRGEIPFAEKVKSAIGAGAAGVLIFNNDVGLISGALTQDGTSVGVPVAMIEKTVGDTLVTALQAGQVARASVSVVKTNYSAFAGTSMASPHVAGVAALVKAANRSLTAAQVRQILSETASPMVASVERPNEFGTGLVDAKAAVLKAISLR
jgi:serine protease